MVRTVDVKLNVIRNSAEYAQLIPTSAPQLRMDESGEIKSSLTGDFIVNEDVDWLSDEIQPVLIIDGVEAPLGVFLPATVTENEDETSRSVRVEAYDRCWRVRDTCSASRTYYAAYRKYLDVVELLIEAAGITSIIKTASSAQLPEAREWAPGTSYLTIVNELLSEINYKPLWFNSQGAAILEPKAEPTAGNIMHTLDSSNVKSLLLPTFKRELDIYQTPNVFIVVCSNPDKNVAMSATARNTSALSPLSIPRRGREIAKVYRVNNIANQAALQAYADNLRNESMYAGETVDVSTALFPGWGLDDITALQYDEHLGIYIERSWTMSLESGGTMTHRLERVVANLG